MTPLERVTALVHNDRHREKTGTSILSDSQLHTLTQKWSGDIGQINEYNRYIGIVRLEHSMRLDAQMFATNAELSLVRNERILVFGLADLKKMTDIHVSNLMQENITKEESLSFALAHTYVEYRHTLHTFTFFNLPLEIREDLVLLDDSVGYSKQYLEDETLLYDMFKGGKLSKKDKDSLVDIIFSRIYYEGIKKMRSGTEKDGFMIGDFFAELPLKEVMYKVAHDASIKCKDRSDEEVLKDIEEYAKEKDVTMENLFRDTLHSWLDNGLFTKDFTPIFASDRHDTWNGNTKKSHGELFAIWYAELEKSKKYFAGLFSAKKLKRQEAEMAIFREKRVVEMLTGESLYACKEDLEFVQEYKKQVEKIMPFSNLVLFIEKYAKPIEKYNTLEEFRRLGKKASDIFGADLTERYDEFIESYKDEVELLNHKLVKLTDLATEHLHMNTKEDFRYNIHITDGKFWFDLEESGETANIVQKYAEEFKKERVV